MKIVMACIAFIASGSTALAASPEPVVTPGPFDPPPAYVSSYGASKVYDWTGFYLGINGGGAFDKTNWTSSPDNTGGVFNSSGGLVGGTAGYNLQFGQPWVYSVEADMDWSNIRGSVSPPSCAPCNFTVPWLATVRLRFGYAFGVVLPYVTGGAAIGGLSANLAGAPAGTANSQNLGWTAGGGVEFAITGALRAKVEYLYINLNGFSCYGPCGGGPISFNPSGSVIRAGLNYRLW